jgi:hypothetical protein
MATAQDFHPEAPLFTGLWRYIWHARPTVVLLAPFIYAGLIPFMLLDVFLSAYHAVCFPVYGIPKVRRQEYLVFDRGRLRYLNALERMNCVYCSYANGLAAYFSEIAARTEQHWCPIKHAKQPAAQHSRYPQFLPFEDAQAYRRRVDEVRHGFDDLR